jgi:hypothetical protein
MIYPRYLTRLYLKLVLLQRGTNLQTINWILERVSLTSFAMLVNGSHSSRDLRQGFPLSPLLFSLVERLWELNVEAMREGAIKRIGVVRSTFISHLLFVDDVWWFAQGSLKEISHFKSIMDSFYGATRMEVNF